MTDRPAHQRWTLDGMYLYDDGVNIAGFTPGSVLPFVAALTAAANAEPALRQALGDVVADATWMLREYRKTLAGNGYHSVHAAHAALEKSLAAARSALGVVEQQEAQR